MRKLIGTSLAILGIMAVPGVARAQGVGRNMGNQPTEGVRFGVGAGLILPMGNYDDGVGFHALGLVQMPLPNSPVHLRADVMFAQTSHKGGSGSTRLIGGTVDALYHFGERAASLRPYVLGGLGYYNAHESVSGTSSSNIAFDLGGGVLFGLGATMHGFAELRYISVQTSGGATAFIPITVGLMFSGN
jgi:hypothetical protein